MNIAYLLNGEVVLIAPEGYTPPEELKYDTSRDGAGANIGDTWDGVNYIPPPVLPEVTNERTLRQQAQQALAANLQDIADANAWLNGVGAGSTALTTAQLSAAVRQMMRALRASKKTENGILRLFLGQFDGTD